VLAVLVEYFDTAELQGLCFDLGVDYDSLAGDEKVSKARELITWFERHSDVAVLIEGIRRGRPGLSLEFRQDETPLAAP
jgi:hypothetical protein